MNKSFYNFNNSQSAILQERLHGLENKVNNMKLMYRKPGSENYENITQVLDSIFHKLNELENRLNNQ